MTNREHLQAIRNNILFQFEQGNLDVVSGNQRSQAFQERTDWGFEFHSFDESTNTPRWGRVMEVGPEVTDDIQVGMRILIDALQWTTHIIHNGEKIWMTNENSILAYDEDSIP